MLKLISIFDLLWWFLSCSSCFKFLFTISLFFFLFLGETLILNFWRLVYFYIILRPTAIDQLLCPFQLLFWLLSILHLFAVIFKLSIHNLRSESFFQSLREAQFFEFWITIFKDMLILYISLCIVVLLTNQYFLRRKIYLANICDKLATLI